MKSTNILPPSVPKDVESALKEFSADIRELYHGRLEAVYLYGSYARGSQNPDSDLDVLVVLRGKVNASQEIHAMSKVAARVCLKYGQLLSTMPVSWDRFRKVPTPFLKNILADAVAL